MNKKLIVSFLSFVSCFCLFAQTEGNKAFQLNVNNGDAYLDCGDVSELISIYDRDVGKCDIERSARPFYHL